jgi:hypothetical protein
MLFAEKKIENGYTYEVNDVFGSIQIESEKQLEGKLLDEIVGVLLRKNLRAQIISGKVENGGSKIKYKFVKAPQWSDDDDTCKDTPTSTSTQASAYTRISRSIGGALSRCKRFAEASHTAWKKSKN